MNIKKFMNQVKFFHPDLYTGPPEIAQIKTQQLNEAYRVLRDADRKADYDDSLHIEKEKLLKQQYHTACNAQRDSARSYESKYEPSDGATFKPAGSKVLLKVLSAISALLLLLLVAVIILFLYGVHNFDMPLSDNSESQSMTDYRSNNTTPSNFNHSPY